MTITGFANNIVR